MTLRLVYHEALEVLRAGNSGLAQHVTELLRRQPAHEERAPLGLAAVLLQCYELGKGDASTVYCEGGWVSAIAGLRNTIGYVMYGAESQRLRALALQHLEFVKQEHAQALVRISNQDAMLSNLRARLSDTLRRAEGQQEVFDRIVCSGHTGDNADPLIDLARAERDSPGRLLATRDELKNEIAQLNITASQQAGEISSLQSQLEAARATIANFQSNAQR